MATRSPAHLLARASWLLLAAGALLLAAACSSSDTEAPATTPEGGPVSGAADDHCGATIQPTTQAACTGSEGGGVAGGGGEATGGAGGEAADDDEYGPTMFNSEGDDDQCKYHLAWSASNVRLNQDATFSLTLTSKVDGAKLAGAEPDLEVFLDETHPAPNSDQKPTETGPGTYAIGPIRFDAPGRWTVRFHLFEMCIDGDESPHGHGAFFVDVP